MNIITDLELQRKNYEPIQLGNSKLKVFSFFSGAGFLDLGFEDNGFDVEYVNELHLPFLDAYKHSREKLNHRKPAFGYDSNSISTFEATSSQTSLIDAVKLCKELGSLVGFIGGPPCPDFSVGGKNRGKNGKNGALSQTYIDLICNVRPDFFLFENVKGLWRTKKHKQFFDELKLKLEKNGYSVKAEVLNALSFGVAQDRDRVIMIGLHKSIGKNVDELLQNFNWKLDRKLEEIMSQDWPQRSAFGDQATKAIPNHLPLELTVNHWFVKNDVYNHPNSKHHFTPRAGLEKFKRIEEGDTDKKSYKRVHRWRYSPTAAYGNNEVHLHPYKARRLSAAEAMAIQSLPKNFELPDTMTLTNMFKTIGNGVPYKMGCSIANQIAELLKVSKNV